MNAALGRTSRIARIAITLAMHRFRSALTNPRSLDWRSFHQPVWPENVAATLISLTGVNRTIGEALGELARVIREECGPVGVVEPADPVADAEVAQVRDRRDVQ